MDLCPFLDGEMREPLLGNKQQAYRAGEEYPERIVQTSRVMDIGNPQWPFSGLCLNCNGSVPTVKQEVHMYI